MCTSFPKVHFGQPKGNTSWFSQCTCTKEKHAQQQTPDPPGVSWSFSEKIKDRTMKVQPQRPTCGKILEHSKNQVSAFREFLGVALCVFKIGVTATPFDRFQDYMARNYTHMWLIFVDNNVGLIHMLEAALISEFQSCTGCRNSPGSGGEGALNRTNHKGPPYYLYICGARADQLERIG